MAASKIVDLRKTEDNKVVFNKEYEFEGKKIKEIDLSKLDDLTAKDMIDANKVYQTNGGFSAMPEITLQYAIILAANATQLPIEFFEQLGAKDATKLKNRVTSFLFSED